LEHKILLKNKENDISDLKIEINEKIVENNNISNTYKNDLLKFNDECKNCID
jgi:hypothetical protein